eukprot:GILK01009170.1.p1 GENE.GILK01009170.1~~GILK01009170.1.p1  ORF type:complete len:1662 (+),score=272.64 GILK01009170.1:89-5074(+)
MDRSLQSPYFPGRGSVHSSLDETMRSSTYGLDTEKSAASPMFKPGLDAVPVSDEQSAVDEKSFVELLGHAGQLIEEALVKEEKATNLESVLTSGAGEGGYTYDVPQFVVSSSLPIPQTIVDEYERMQYAAFMGLFPEISRAWVTFDNRIYLWNYDEPSEIQTYDGLNQIIVSAGLVRPKPNIFVDEVQYLLVLSTAVEVVLLGVCFSGNSTKGDMSLILTQYSVPTDNIKMVKIKGSATGRIFMGGQDGNLYELSYQSEESWFSRKCRKLNHSGSRLNMLIPSFLQFGPKEGAIIDIAIDSSRNILYSLSESSTITVFDMGESGQELIKIASLRREEIGERMAMANEKARVVQNAISLVAISVIERHEAERVSLLAVTSNGIRIYFSVTATEPYSIMSSSSSAAPRLDPSRPAGLRVVYVRLPPPLVSNEAFTARNRTYAPGITPQGLGNVHVTHISKGVVLLADSRSEESDSVIGLSLDLASLAQRQQTVHQPRPMGTTVSAADAYLTAPRQGLEEMVTGIDFEFQQHLAPRELRDDTVGRVWDIAEIPTASSIPAALAELYVNSNVPPTSSASSWVPGSGTIPLGMLSELATQQILPPRRFVYMTHSDLYFVSKVRPVDILLRLFAAPQIDEAQIQRFFLRFTDAQACAMCLAIATSIYLSSTSLSPLQAARSSLSMLLPPTTTSQQHPSSSFSFSSPPPLNSFLSPAHNRRQVSNMSAIGGGAPAPAPVVLPTPSEHNAVSLAAGYFFKFGARQDVLTTAQPAGPSLVPSYRSTIIGRAIHTPEPTYSGKHEGLCLFVSRLLRPFWMHGVTVVSGDDKKVQKCRWTMEQRHDALTRFRALLKFIQDNQQRLAVSAIQPGRNGLNAQKTGSPPMSQPSRRDVFSPYGPTPSHASNTPRATSYASPLQPQQQQGNLNRSMYGAYGLQSPAGPAPPATPYGGGHMGTPGPSMAGLRYEDPLWMEQRSLEALCAFIKRCEEAFALLGILVDHNNFPRLVSALLPEMQVRLSGLTFASFVAAEEGAELARALIAAMIEIKTGLDPRKKSQQIRSTLISGLCDELRRDCPTFFSQADMYLHKAYECLQRAKQVLDEEERELLLTECLDLYTQQVAASANLPFICQEFSAVHFYWGVVDLCLRKAKALDPKNLAVKSTAIDDPKVQELHSSRMECYAHILDMLDVLLSEFKPPETKTDNAVVITAEQRAQYRAKAFQRAVESDDELFHYALYQWLIDRNLQDELLSIDSPLVERVLRRDEMLVKCPDLLWQFYVRRGNFAAATQVLYRLATQTGDSASKLGVTIERRIRYLCLAIDAAKSALSQSAHMNAMTDMLERLQDLMEVANVQLKIYNELVAKADVAPSTDAEASYREAASQLQHEVFDISDLYNKFASKYKLHECCLGVLYCSGHQDATLIRRYWQRLIEEHSAKSADKQWPEPLLSKMEELGHSYSSCDWIFPVDFIIDQLEKQQYRHLAETTSKVAGSSFEMPLKQEAIGFVAPASTSTVSTGRSWVPALLRRVGVSTSTIASVYMSLLESRDPFWHDLPHLHHIFVVVTDVIESWTYSVEPVINGYFRKQLSDQRAIECEEFVRSASWLLKTVRYCQTIAPKLAMTDDELKQLTQRLQEMESTISRILDQSAALGKSTNSMSDKTSSMFGRYTPLR